MSQDPSESPVRVWISSITFSDGTRIALTANDITVIVGPNNSGKSATLRGISSKFENRTHRSPVVTDLEFEKKGDPGEFEEWIRSWAIRSVDGSQENPIFQSMGHQVRRNVAINGWISLDSGSANNPLSRWFLLLLGGEQRLTTANPAQAIRLTSENPTHPIHYLARNDELELQLSASFKSAFGTDLVVHRNAGNEVPLYVGERPVPAKDEDRVSLPFLERLEKLPKLHEQGDGMRSFASVLLATSVGKETIVLIDEPEAFLHPPQAKLLGQNVIAAANGRRQIFIATHSSDVLKGVLSQNNGNVRVLRIERHGQANRVRLLSNSDINELWSDSLFRHSNILDGLFHERVIVCESDSDCSFYSAIANVVSGQEKKQPDLHFVHCGGKARIALVARALVKVGVPVRVVCDFDVLSEEQPLRNISEALGCPWEEIQRDWKIVKSAIDAKRPDRTVAEVKAEIDDIFSSETSDTFSKAAKARIANVLKLTTAWANAKSLGKAYVPPGDASQAVHRLLSKLKSHGVHVVDVGELEGFLRTVPDHGPKWVAEVVQRDLATDPDLEGARRFVHEIIESED
ncbi:AAA family ATPase [uncultured Arenimonas sp.]|uniref:ATP-dependent nuclease n=1 Tax=uncultured Arenimonas sp. TaxID=546226 RepID=UPI0030D7BAA9